MTKRVDDRQKLKYFCILVLGFAYGTIIMSARLKPPSPRINQFGPSQAILSVSSFSAMALISVIVVSPTRAQCCHKCPISASTNV
eukprot:2064590-Rhodomonas_salina.1